MRCLGIAHGSLCEVETQIYIAGKLGYVPKSDVDELIELSSEVGRLLNGLLRSLPLKMRQNANGCRQRPLATCVYRSRRWNKRYAVPNPATATPPRTKRSAGGIASPEIISTAR
jgi:hypothetical protein